MSSQHICNNCKARIDGTRWKCLVCDDYDLCAACYKKGPPFMPPHDANHSVKPFRGDQAEEELHSEVYNISTLAELKEIANRPDSKAVVCNFFANWYKPSIQFFPVFSRMSLEFPEVRFLRVDMDLAQDITKHYKLTTPTIKIFQKGHKTLNFSGVNVLANPTELEMMIDYELKRAGFKRVDPPPQQQDTSKENSKPEQSPLTISKPKHFPTKEFLVWPSTGQLDKICVKLFEFSDQLKPPLGLSSIEVSHIKSLSDILADAKNYDNTQISPSEFDMLKRVLTTCPFEKLFPALDLFRLVLLHSHGYFHFGRDSELYVFEHLLQNVSVADSDNSKLVALRVFSNVFRGAKETVIKLGGGLTNTLSRLTPLIRTEKKPNQVALSYLLLNYAITVQGQMDSTTHITDLFNFIVEFLQTKQDEESLYRILVALGTLRSNLTTEQVKSALILIQNNQTIPSDNGRTKEALNELASTL